MHWTYESYTDEDDLRQGDILEPSQTLLPLFKDVHPHFTDSKYRGFLVLSQTCDMVRRHQKGGKCDATHISLSVIRSLQDIISYSLKDRFGYIAPGIYNSGMKNAVENLAERLVNQNEEKLGLFYLHPDLDAGISTHSVAILRVSISVKASLHYEKLLKSRMGRLSSEFQPKLGWMVGNLYSRVGVTDWKEAPEKGFDEKKLISEILSFDRDKPLWLDSRIYSKILKSKPDFMQLSQSEQDKLIKEHLPLPPEEKIIEIIASTISNTAKIKAEQLEAIKHKLKNNDQLAAQMKKFGRF
jgi:hypothetical protein